MLTEECVGFEVMAADWRELPKSMEALLISVSGGENVEKDWNLPFALIGQILSTHEAEA